MDCSNTQPASAPAAIIKGNNSALNNPNSISFSPATSGNNRRCLAIANFLNNTVAIYSVDCTNAQSTPQLITVLDATTSMINGPQVVVFAPFDPVTNTSCLAVFNLRDTPGTITIYSIDCTTSLASPPAPIINIPTSIMEGVASNFRSLAFSQLNTITGSACLAVSNATDGANTSVFIYSINCRNPQATSLTPTTVIDAETGQLTGLPVSLAFSPLTANGTSCLAVANSNSLEPNNSTVTIYTIDCSTPSSASPAPFVVLDNAISGINNAVSVAFSTSGCLAVANAGASGTGSDSTVTLYALECGQPSGPLAPSATLNSTSGINVTAFQRGIDFSPNGCLAVSNLNNVTIYKINSDCTTQTNPALPVVTLDGSSITNPANLSYSVDNCLAVINTNGQQPGVVIFRSTQQIPITPTLAVDTSNCPTITFSGTTDPNVSVTIFSANSSPIASTQSDSNGNFSVSSQLANGTYSFTAQASNATNCMSALSSEVTVQINCQPTPTVTPLPINKKFSCLARAILNKYCRN
ncbi:carboxypeptidase regulatory-like domain-containing protein [Candidatus Dependentiae bacterium]|nr:carboxypeptidase regulatory-like domain-containing protein [Candidatus Dependentiae bacterium]